MDIEFYGHGLSMLVENFLNSAARMHPGGCTPARSGTARGCMRRCRYPPYTAAPLLILGPRKILLFDRRLLSATNPAITQSISGPQPQCAQNGPLPPRATL